jgi:hypothetical protein
MTIGLDPFRALRRRHRQRGSTTPLTWRTPGADSNDTAVMGHIDAGPRGMRQPQCYRTATAAADTARSGQDRRSVSWSRGPAVLVFLGGGKQD